MPQVKWGNTSPRSKLSLPSNLCLAHELSSLPGSLSPPRLPTPDPLLDSQRQQRPTLRPSRNPKPQGHPPGPISRQPHPGRSCHLTTARQEHNHLHTAAGGNTDARARSITQGERGKGLFARPRTHWSGCLTARSDSCCFRHCLHASTDQYRVWFANVDYVLMHSRPCLGNAVPHVFVPHV